LIALCVADVYTHRADVGATRLFWHAYASQATSLLVKVPHDAAEDVQKHHTEHKGHRKNKNNNRITV